MKVLAQLASYAEAERLQQILISAGIDADVRYSAAGPVAILAATFGSHLVLVRDDQEEVAERLLRETGPSSMIAVDGIGEFAPSRNEAARIAHLRGLLPDMSTRDLLILIFLQATVATAINSQNRKLQSPHVSGAELLSFARLVALNQFGKDARRWMRGLGLSCSADIGKSLFRFMDAGIFSKQPSDDPADFDIKSDYDVFINEEG